MEGMDRDQEIVAADGGPGVPEAGADPSELDGGGGGKIQHLQRAEKLGQGQLILFRPRTAGNPELQFTVSNRRDADIPDLEFPETGI